MAVGTQQRSSSHFQKAVEIVQSGKLGKIFWVQTWNFENISPSAWASSPTARRRPTSITIAGSAPRHSGRSIPNRFHLLFRWFFDYAGGMMSDWGVHLNDIVLWALNCKGRNRFARPAGSSPPTTIATRPTPCRSFTNSRDAP